MSLSQRFVLVDHALQILSEMLQLGSRFTGLFVLFAVRGFDLVHSLLKVSLFSDSLLQLPS